MSIAAVPGSGKGGPAGAEGVDMNTESPCPRLTFPVVRDSIRTFFISCRKRSDFVVRVYQVEELEGCLRTPMVVCLGVFDGVHLGHRKLVEESERIAGDKGMTALVHTYNPMPMCVISPESCPCELTPLETKIRLLGQVGIQNVAVSRFTQKLRMMPGREFFEQVLIGKLNARHIVAGFNHHFGYRGDTDVMTLEAMCHHAGIGLSVIAPVKTPQGRLVSSTAVRAALLKNDLRAAEEMLGRKPEPELIACALRIAPELKQ